MDYQLVKNMINKTIHGHQRLNNDIMTSIRKWIVKLKAMDWHVHYDLKTKPETKVVVAFFSLWQKQQMRLHGTDLLCIDFTHNATKFIPELGVKKLSTITVLLRQPDTGRVLPVAWFLTSDETA